MAVSVKRDTLTKRADEVVDDVIRDTIFERDVPVSKMFVHYRELEGGYARPSNSRRVEKLAKNFDSMAVGVLLLSLREDGTYAVIDGSHRLAAAIKSGLTTLDAYVYIDLTLEEEADLYRKFGDYLKQTALDRYVAALVAQVPEMLAINRIIEEAGLHVSVSGGPEAGGVMAIQAILAIVEINGPQMLRDVLAVHKDAFPEVHGSFEGWKIYTGTSLRGTAMFLERYGKNPAFNRARLIEHIKQEGLNGLKQRANAVRALDHKANTNACWGQALLAAYNHAIRNEANRLPGWAERAYTEKSLATARESMANALKASVQARRVKANENARAVATCPDCRAEPGADCKNPRGQSLMNEVHGKRHTEARRIKQRTGYANGKT